MYPPTAPPPQYSQPTTTNLPANSTVTANTGYYPSNNAQQYGGASHLQSRHHVPWSTGLCDCTANCKLCCITFWCPCITFGRIAEIVDRGSSSCGVSGALYALIGFVTGYACLYSCFYRSKMRQQYMLKESPCGDCLVHCCCEPCALCQEYRELESRGFNMIIGWHGNVEQGTSGVAPMPPTAPPTAPSIEPGMNR